MNKLAYLGKRLILGVPVVLFGLTMTFAIIYASPFDPTRAILGRDADPQTARQLAVALGLRYPDGTPVPLWIQYKNFLVDTITFDFGQSWVLTRGESVEELILERMPATVWLGFWAVVTALLVGIPLGLYAGLRSNSWGDYMASFGGIIWRAMPNFWLAVIISGSLSTGILSFYPDLFIDSGVITQPDALSHMLYDSRISGLPVLGTLSIPVPHLTNIAVAFKWILPASLILGSASMGNEVRIGRTAVLESMNAQYIETAKAKGLSARAIIGKHVARNAMIPLLPVIMGEFYLLIGGSVLVELIFGIRGLGNLFLSAILNADIPIIMALVYIFILIQIAFNIAQDIAYTYIDPRISLEGGNE